MSFLPRLTRPFSASCLAVALAMLLGACQGDEPVAPKVTTVGVTVTVSSVGVIADCEPAAGNAGDFTFELVVWDPALDPADYLRFTGSFSSVGGVTVDLADIVFTMQRQPMTGDFFTLEFHVTEWDGTTPDSRMNDSIGDATHTWTAGTDWQNGPGAISVSGDTECRVSFNYSVTAS